MDRLADLIPQRRKQRHRYHGVFAPNHRLRPAMTALAVGRGLARVPQEQVPVPVCPRLSPSVPVCPRLPPSAPVCPRLPPGVGHRDEKPDRSGIETGWQPLERDFRKVVVGLACGADEWRQQGDGIVEVTAGERQPLLEVAIGEDHVGVGIAGGRARGESLDPQLPRVERAGAVGWSHERIEKDAASKFVNASVRVFVNVNLNGTLVPLLQVRLSWA
jgi:hypothetical protein